MNKNVKFITKNNVIIIIVCRESISTQLGRVNVLHSPLCSASFHWPTNYSNVKARQNLNLNLFNMQSNVCIVSISTKHMKIYVIWAYI